jgi:RimJ/RimL family protein N-acetyltransferase
MRNEGQTMSIPTIHTQRLALRPFEVSDAQVVQSLAGIGDVALTTQNIPHPYEDGMAEAWIASHRPDWDEGKLLTLAITEDSEGVVGAMGIRINSVHRRGEIGYWVGLPFWNRGYATESARAFLEFGFGELALNRIQARHMTRNPSSGRVLEKLGMKMEGVQRQHVLARGRFEDVAMYAILRSEYHIDR